MQPFTAELARVHFQPQTEGLRIGSATYQVKFEGAENFVEEDGPRGRRKLQIAHAMGGKSTYYLLTPMERGRLQVLPVAYDVQSKRWYDMAASGVRIHGDGAALPWTDPAFTFNTSCYGCHTSQTQTNYDTGADRYQTTWKEPGINCEACHGEAAAHLQSAKSGDPHIARMGNMTAGQRNEVCAPCHAKMSALSASYQPQQRFFDHYDLTGLESADFYADGRDLGENYTYTGWLMSSCVRSGKFDCLHCHTSTGAFRFAGNDSDQACMPCHQNVVKHSHHGPDSAGVRCIGCHMPTTRFANMRRTDHSMLPPAPKASQEFSSPNACNICHAEKDARWADGYASKWYKGGYQNGALERARLIDAARHGQWTKAREMLAYIRDAKSNAVVTTSLLRLMRPWDDPRKVPALMERLGDASPLVRAAAASGLAEVASREDVQAALLKAAADDYRLVRIRAAASLGPVNVAATGELEQSFLARPDDFNNQTNLGNFYLRRGKVEQAVQCFELAIRLRPDSVGTLVNASVAYSRAGRPADAERVLRQAVGFAPKNAAVLFNLGLLLAEANRNGEAEEVLRAALEVDPKMAAAAYNLAILVSGRDLKQAIALCRRAVAVSREERYLRALAQFLAKDGQIGEAKRVFERR